MIMTGSFAICVWHIWLFSWTIGRLAVRHTQWKVLFSIAIGMDPDICIFAFPKSIPHINSVSIDMLYTGRAEQMTLYALGKQSYIQFALYSLQWPGYTIQCALQSLQWSVYSVHHTRVHCTVCIAKFTVISVNCTVYNHQCKMYSAQYKL